MAHQDAFNFETGPIRYRKDAFRFLNGTPHIPCLYAARPGLELIGKIGVPEIRRKSIRQTAYLVELASAEGFGVTVPTKTEDRGGTVAVRPPCAYEVSRELLLRKYLIDFRPGAGIRISPHFYTSDLELEAVITEIRKILDSRAHEKHIGSKHYVT
jgi:kynureninase